MFTTIFEVLSNALYYVGYVRGSSFQQSLDREEEACCIPLLSERDEEAGNKLTEHNLCLVVHVVKKCDIKKEQTEDLISIDITGLTKAMGSFKPEKGYKLTIYVSKRIENEILMYLRSSKNYSQNVSLSEPIATDEDGSGIILTDATSSSEGSSITDNTTVEDNIARLRHYIHVLNARELEIVTRRFGPYGQEEETQREIARQLHISCSYISRIEKRAFMKIYREFQKEEKRKERLRQNKEKE